MDGDRSDNQKKVHIDSASGHAEGGWQKGVCFRWSCNDRCEEEYENQKVAKRESIENESVSPAVKVAMTDPTQGGSIRVAKSVKSRLLGSAAKYRTS